jgi:hypothetical protein
MAYSRFSSLSVGKGVCYALFAYDVGLSIDLNEADRRIEAFTERGSIRPKRRAPNYFEFRPAPLRVTREAVPITFGPYTSSPTVDLMLYDIGALSIAYRIPIEGLLDSLLELSEELYENPQLLIDSRNRVEHLLETIHKAVERPQISPQVEDYVIFHVEASEGATGNQILQDHDHELAQIMRCERSQLSEQEVKDATSHRISFGPDDLAIIDWNASLLFGTGMEDVRAVLEFVNVELLEMRLLDNQLDVALDQAYESLTKKLWRGIRWPGTFESASTRIAQMQVDSALLFERVSNTLKLLGDQYLARVYRMASQRFHLESWDGSIMRKLQTLDSIYGKMTDRVSTKRLEVLEWIIIILIAVSIVISFVPGASGR